MLFRDLYEIVANGEHIYVEFEMLRKLVVAHHEYIGRIDVISIRNNPPTDRAFYRLADSDRSTAYDDEYQVAEIVYCSRLDEDKPARRFALTKELMHVFDGEDEKTDSRAKFIQLMHEVQNRPLPQHASAMYRSEGNTRWMAALILCPKPHRDKLYAEFKEGQLLTSEIAEIFRIPEWVASNVMDEYYDEAFEALVKGNGK